MTSRYLEQLNTIAVNDFVATVLLTAAGLIVLTLYLSNSVQWPRLRDAVRVSTCAVALVTYFALLLSPYIGAL